MKHDYHGAEIVVETCLGPDGWKAVAWLGEECLAETDAEHPSAMSAAMEAIQWGMA